LIEPSYFPLDLFEQVSFFPYRESMGNERGNIAIEATMFTSGIGIERVFGRTRTKRSFPRIEKAYERHTINHYIFFREQLSRGGEAHDISRM